MSLFPDQLSLTSPPEKPKLTPEERRARYTDRLTTIRLRMLIFRELDERGIMTPAAINEALDMPAAEMVRPLARYHCTAEPTKLRPALRCSLVHALCHAA